MVLDRARAQARYVVCWVALVAVLVLPIVPQVWAVLSPGQPLAHVSAEVVPVVSMPPGWWTSSTLVLAFWALWATVQMARLGSAAWALRRAKTGCREIGLEREQRLQYWMQVRSAGRPARLVVSEHVRSAAVLGFGSPVVAVTPKLFTHLTADEIDRVVVHEWAHVQRRDDLAHLAQLLARIVAGWHPVVWWIDRQLRIEREVACDETAVAVTRSAKDYAACLARLASLAEVRVQPTTALAALSSSNLRRRVVRILSTQPKPSRRSTVGATSLIAVVLCFVTFAVGGVMFVETMAADDVVPAPVPYASNMSSSDPAADRLSEPTSIDDARTQREPSSSGVRQVGPSQGRTPDALSAPVGEAVSLRPPTPAVPSMNVNASSALPATPPLRPLERGEAHLFTPSLVASTTSTAAFGPVATEAKQLWTVAADAGVAVGRGSQKGAVATAGFFTRMSKRIAGSF
jgi:beta-lactamase regulating signal transducer with metallopeptidase domain